MRRLLCWIFGHPKTRTKWFHVGMGPITYRTFCVACGKVLRAGIP